MKYKFILVLFSLFLTLSLGSFKQVLACSACSRIPSFCEIVGGADAIFVGKVIGGKKRKTTNENGVKEVWDVGEIYFEVQQSFVGVKKGNRITVRSGDEDGYCGMWFKHKETYLVFGYGDTKKGFVTGNCSRTSLISEAGEDLESLKNLPKSGTGSKIFGKIIQDVKSSLEKDSRQPLSELTLKIQQLNGNKRFFETITGVNGDYEINGIPAGKYNILPNLSKSIEFQDSEVEVKDRGCVNQDFLIRNKTKISGRVIDVEGKPVKEISVELLPANLTEKPRPFTFREDGLTDENGNFVIENVPPGQYTMSINYTNSPDEDDAFPTTFYPNSSEKPQAMIFEISLGSDDIKDIEFRLPPRLVAQEIKGLVVWSDGTTAYDIHVGLRDAEDDLFTSDFRTDKLGNFTLQGFGGRKYYISADNYSSNNAESASYLNSDKFILSENVKFFRLILEKKEK